MGESRDIGRQGVQGLGLRDVSCVQGVYEEGRCITECAECT